MSEVGSAWCDTHGLIPVNLVSVKSATAAKITFVNSQWVCPHCRKQIPILDGTYEASVEAVSLLSAPEWTWEKLKEAQSAAQWASEALRIGAPLPDVVKELGRKSPLLAGVVEQKREAQGWDRADILSLIQAVAAIIALLVSGASLLVALHPPSVNVVVENKQDAPSMPPTGPKNPSRDRTFEAWPTNSGHDE